MSPLPMKKPLFSWKQICHWLEAPMMMEAFYGKAHRLIVTSQHRVPLTSTLKTFLEPMMTPPTWFQDLSVEPPNPLVTLLKKTHCLRPPNSRICHTCGCQKNLLAFQHLLLFKPLTCDLEAPHEIRKYFRDGWKHPIG